MAEQDQRPIVGILMGSRSDWDVMSNCASTLDSLGIPYEVRVLSAHRTPHAAIEYASTAEARGLQTIIAGAGGAAHLAGMMAGLTVVPVLGVPLESQPLKGMGSLLSIVQMPGGIPVGTLAIGKPGATNAALLAAAFIGNSNPAVREALRAYRTAQTEKILASPDIPANQSSHPVCCAAEGLQAAIVRLSSLSDMSAFGTVRMVPTARRCFERVRPLAEFREPPAVVVRSVWPNFRFNRQDARCLVAD